MHRAGIRAYGFTIAIGIITSVVEFVGSRLTESVGLFADALHLLGDLLPLFIGLAAIILRSGFLERRTTELNLVLLTAIGLWIAWESLERYFSPRAVDPQMLLFAMAGCFGNGIQMLRGQEIRHAHDHDHTGESQWLHLMMDFVASACVLLGAILLHLTGSSRWDLAAAVAVTSFTLLTAAKIALKMRHHH
jgi:Co/Zn/Cd efflux system component